MGKKVISIDLGVMWTKVALLEVHRKAPHVYDTFIFRTPENAVDDGYIVDKEGFAECLKEELGKRQIEERNLVFSLNSSKIIIREMSIPNVKNSQLDGIVEAQAKDCFPMDVSEYTISYRKMDIVEKEGQKMLNLLLIAIPDNLLNNYVVFAENTGFEIESFGYIGNSAVSLMTSRFSENAVVVQLEEQSTIISIISNKKLVFQRIAPYGYRTSLTTALEHKVLGVEDEYEAFEFLCEHNVLSHTPNAADYMNTGIDDVDERQALLDAAFSDIKEVLSYHVRVVNTAIEYYKNQSDIEFQGKLHLIGDGVRIKGVKKFFKKEMPLQFDDVDYNFHIRYASGGMREAQAANLLPVVGVAIQPLNIRPKESREKQDKKNSLQSAYMVFLGSAVISVLLMVTGTARYLVATAAQDKLEEKIAELSYIEAIYEENEAARTETNQYVSFDEMTKTQNEKLSELIESLENELPTAMVIHNMTISEENITLGITCDTKLTAAQMLLNLEKIPFLANITIPSMAESEDASGNKVWQFSVMANYVEPVTSTEGEE